MMKPLLFIVLMLAAATLYPAPQTAADGEWRLYQKAVKQKKHYDAAVHAMSACHLAANLTVAKKYCPTALNRSRSWTSGACFAIETHHKMCGMGSRSACLEAAAMNRHGWHGEKEPCPHQEIYGTGDISETRARIYEEKAHRALQP